jgi:tRNA dimethylallyltransferase
MENGKKMIVILGPTASGKTKLAAEVAFRVNGEVISADSRQVYRGMDIGTGKDYNDYLVEGKRIPFHLIDIADPGTEYNVFQYQQEFLKSWHDITSRGKTPVLCGGTGLYLEAVLKGYSMIHVPPDNAFREELEKLPLEKLGKILVSYRLPHNLTDLKDKQRAIRSIEIGRYYHDHQNEVSDFPHIIKIIFGILLERQAIKEKITQRLDSRLKEGMIDEVKHLLDTGLKPDQLKFYGLEYRYVTQYVTGELSYNDMFQKLNSAIHQFAKRQMTWFRKMERDGLLVHWIDGRLPLEEKVDITVARFNKNS